MSRRRTVFWTSSLATSRHPPEGGECLAQTGGSTGRGWRSATLLGAVLQVNVSYQTLYFPTWKFRIGKEQDHPNFPEAAGRVNSVGLKCNTCEFSLGWPGRALVQLQRTGSATELISRNPGLRPKRIATTARGDRIIIHSKVPALQYQRSNLCSTSTSPSGRAQPRSREAVCVSVIPLR